MQEHRDSFIYQELASRLDQHGISIRVFCSVLGISDPVLCREYGELFSLNNRHRIPLDQAKSLARIIADDRRDRRLSKRRKPLSEGLSFYREIFFN